MSELTGPWDKVIYRVKNLNEQMKPHLAKATAKSAMMVEAALVKHIQSQDLGWHALNKAYLKWKIRNKLSDKIWIATSTLINSVTHKIADGGLEAFVGVLRTAKSADGKNQVLIASVLEFGSAKRNIKPRPLFRPTFQEMKPKIIENYDKAVRKALDEVVKSG